MKPPEDPLSLLVRQWIAKAEIDYLTAQQLLGAEEPIRESIAFHCQQAVEKYLKAVLVAQRMEFPKTHSIAQLLDLIAGFAPTFAAGLSGTIPLTPFGVQIRYPGDFAELLPGQERTVFELVSETRADVLNRLASYLARG